MRKWRKRQVLRVIPADRTFRGGIVHMEELIRPLWEDGTPPILRELVFEDCMIMGPSVLAMVDHNQFIDCEFGVDSAAGIDSILWPIDGRTVVGCVGINACLFERCTFRLVGFAADSEFLAKMRREVAGS